MLLSRAVSNALHRLVLTGECVLQNIMWDFIEGNSYINNIFVAEKNLRRLPRLLTYLKGAVRRPRVLGRV